MRESSWRITWNPLGTEPRVMLDFGDLMEREITLDSSQLSAIGSFDFAVSATPSARGNRRRRLDFGKIVVHDSDTGSWHECAVQLAAGPWGGSAAGVIEIRPRVGSALLLRGALLSSAHEPTSDQGLAESVHEWSFRCTRLVFTPIGDGITIIGGWYNPPGGGITIIIPGGSGIVPGDVVHVVDVPGVPGGYYPVGSTGSSGGNSTITIPAAEPGRDKPSQAGVLSMPAVTGSSRGGWMEVTFGSSEIRVIGCTDLATYAVWNGAAWVGIAPDAWGEATVAVSIASKIEYSAWWGLNDFFPGPPSLDPLALDGQSKPNGDGIDCTQTGPSKFTARLRRNGVEIDSFTLAPSWAGEKMYGTGPANHVLSSGMQAVVTLVGPGGGTPYDPGIPAQITSGTVTKVTAQEVAP